MPSDLLYPHNVSLQSIEISRASLREALTRLAALGLLEIKAGKGVYVISQHSQAAEQWDGEHRVSLKDFYQLRYVLESFAHFSHVSI